PGHEREFAPVLHDLEVGVIQTWHRLLPHINEWRTVVAVGNLVPLLPLVVPVNDERFGGVNVVGPLPDSPRIRIDTVPPTGLCGSRRPLRLETDGGVLEDIRRILPRSDIGAGR